MLFLLLTPLILFLAVYAFLVLVVGLLSRLPQSESRPVPKPVDLPPDIARLTQPMEISDLQVVILALLGAAIVALPFMLFIINH
jgi:hypothetical protein